MYSHHLCRRQFLGLFSGLDQSISLLQYFMSDYNEYNQFNLPLQPRQPIANSIPCKCQDMPKQIHNDAYRVIAGKQNTNHNYCPITIPQHILHSSQKEQANYIQKSCKQSKNEKLRSIINKQLSSKRLTPVIRKDDAEQKAISRYQQLLRQVYGQPNTLCKPNHPARQASIKRKGSLKTITTQQSANKLEQQRSEAIIKSNPSSGYKSLALRQKSTCPTYLQLYMQKRKALLFV